jgi:nicotinamidase-related amidase
MTSVLLLVDVQRNMLEPPTPVPDAAAVSAAIEDILSRARAAGTPVVHIRNNGGAGDPDESGTPGWELTHEVRDGEPVVDKHQADAFAGTPLAELLPASADLVVVGMQSEYCIRATSLSALDRGHRVSVVCGAHATYPDQEPAEKISQQVEEELGAAGAAIVDRAQVTFL